MDILLVLEAEPASFGLTLPPILAGCGKSKLGLGVQNISL
jgi:hypothetical protein